MGQTMKEEWAILSSSSNFRSAFPSKAQCHFPYYHIFSLNWTFLVLCSPKQLLMYHLYFFHSLFDFEKSNVNRSTVGFTFSALQIIKQDFVISRKYSTI